MSPQKVLPTVVVDLFEARAEWDRSELSAADLHAVGVPRGRCTDPMKSARPGAQKSWSLIQAQNFCAITGCEPVDIMSSDSAKQFAAENFGALYQTIEESVATGTGEKSVRLMFPRSFHNVTESVHRSLKTQPALAHYPKTTHTEHEREFIKSNPALFIQTGWILGVDEEVIVESREELESFSKELKDRFPEREQAHQAGVMTLSALLSRSENKVRQRKLFENNMELSGARIFHTKVTRPSTTTVNIRVYEDDDTRSSYDFQHPILMDFHLFVVGPKDVEVLPIMVRDHVSMNIWAEEDPWNTTAKIGDREITITGTHDLFMGEGK